ncbi:MAG: hypothetical protein IOC49_04740 [Methylobacterium sp.]|nr:hypothetical protein [Methylobacterium sp.]
MAESVFGFVVFAVVGILLFLRAKGAAIRKKEEGIACETEERVTQPVLIFDQLGFWFSALALAAGALAILRLRTH